jgi:hypothetical protein
MSNNLITMLMDDLECLAIGGLVGAVFVLMIRLRYVDLEVTAVLLD